MTKKEFKEIEKNEYRSFCHFVLEGHVMMSFPIHIVKYEEGLNISSFDRILLDSIKNNFTSDFIARLDIVVIHNKESLYDEKTELKLIKDYILFQKK